MKTPTGVLGLGWLTLAIGCATTAPDLPRGSRVVGGGLSLEWDAPEAGTAILREETTRRIVATETLEEGGTFHFPSGGMHLEALNMLFGDPMPTNLTFVLYFAPAPKPRE